jgi:endonuclease/exonuclease/phosphatase family metal-dependent hydrolase
MLQEAIRTGDVPALVPAGAESARRLGSARDLERADIASLADRLGMSVLYVPSMRNGGASSNHPPSDRGNAILSTLPLTNATAIELPGARQRRVAVTADITVHASGGDRSMTVVAVHMDALGSPRSLWFFGGPSTRLRQASSLVEALSDRPAIVGADLNSWLGPGEGAVSTLLRAFPSTPRRWPRGTFNSELVLDYLFFRLPPAWHATVVRAPDRYGSDHFPLVGRVSG